jgi:DNA repair photolyase
MCASIAVREIQAKSILGKSGVSGMSYSVNPYTGCEHACIYCYATFMKEYSRHNEAWGDFVDVKVNLPDILSQEVKKKKIGKVCIGTVADPYQPIEKERKLMRAVIEILKSHNFPFYITTKSALISRDIDLLANYFHCLVSITITTTDEKIRKIFEPNADSINDRLNCLKELIKAKIQTQVFFGPILPYFSDSSLAIDEIFSTFKSTGVTRILVDKMNYLKSKVDIILEKTGAQFPEVKNYYKYLLKHSNQYNIWVKQNIYKMAQKHNLIAEVVF